MSHRCDELTENTRRALEGLVGKTYRNISIHPPAELDEAVFYASILSKLSPTVGNILEYSLAKALSKELGGDWVRQDPDFPDLVVSPDSPFSDCGLGVEIKAWYPLATEATARFKESQANLRGGSILLVLIAWVPDHILFGSPMVISVFVNSALRVAQARDMGYHRPPDNVLLEPFDTTQRTRNLRQRVVNAIKLQEDRLSPNTDPEALMASLARKHGILEPTKYDTSERYQKFAHSLAAALPYRNETNFGKIDRIPYAPLSTFISSTYEETLYGLSVASWRAALRNLKQRRLRADPVRASLSAIGLHNLLPS